MKVLVLNCGSSSAKFQLFETSLEAIEKGEELLLAKGNVEKIGMSNSIVTFQATGKEGLKETPTILEHRGALEKIIKLLLDPKYGCLEKKEEIQAVGHRVVHGGEYFSTSKLITEDVYHKIQECIELAPLHNPANIKGYEVASQLLPDVPHCAVFDTAFHQTMAPKAYLYGLPHVLYTRHHIRRYGFHGSSHRYVAWRLHKMLGIKFEELNCITAHLGNGCSIAAINEGKSRDTSMGFTPLEGLLMGTRTGDLDPAVILHIMAKEELGLHEANTLMNKHSGLQGISGVSNDLREVMKAAAEGNDRARWAIEIFAFRVQKYTGAYLTVAGKPLHGIVFTGGIGENAVPMRKAICDGLASVDVEIDPELNATMVGGKEGKISTDSSRYPVYVIPTNEELVIARDTVRAMAGMLK